MDFLNDFLPNPLNTQLTPAEISSADKVQSHQLLPFSQKSAPLENENVAKLEAEQSSNHQDFINEDAHSLPAQSHD
jgi:hypothetical protein